MSDAALLEKEGNRYYLVLVSHETGFSFVNLWKDKASHRKGEGLEKLQNEVRPKDRPHLSESAVVSPPAQSHALAHAVSCLAHFAHLSRPICARSLLPAVVPRLGLCSGHGLSLYPLLVLLPERRTGHSSKTPCLRRLEKYTCLRRPEQAVIKEAFSVLKHSSALGNHVLRMLLPH